MLVVILLCIVGAIVSAAMKYEADQNANFSILRYDEYMTTAGQCASDPTLASHWRKLADRSLDKHTEFKLQANKFNAYIALNLGAIVLCVIYLVYTGKI